MKAHAATASPHTAGSQQLVDTKQRIERQARVQAASVPSNLQVCIVTSQDEWCGRRKVDYLHDGWCQTGPDQVSMQCVASSQCLSRADVAKAVRRGAKQRHCESANTWCHETQPNPAINQTQNDVRHQICVSIASSQTKQQRMWAHNLLCFRHVGRDVARQ